MAHNDMSYDLKETVSFMNKNIGNIMLFIFNFMKVIRYKVIILT